MCLENEELRDDTNSYEIKCIYCTGNSIYTIAKQSRFAKAVWPNVMRIYCVRSRSLSPGHCLLPPAQFRSAKWYFSSPRLQYKTVLWILISINNITNIYSLARLKTATRRVLCASAQFCSNARARTQKFFVQGEHRIHNLGVLASSPGLKAGVTRHLQFNVSLANYFTSFYCGSRLPCLPHCRYLFRRAFVSVDSLWMAGISRNRGILPPGFYKIYSWNPEPF